MRRALTLLETLLSLALLSAVTGLLISWLTIASGTTTLVSSASSWEITARRSLSLVYEDIMSFDLEELNRQAREPRVIVGAGELSIRTRTAAQRVTARYGLDSGGALRRSTTSGSGGQALLENVSAFECEFDESDRILRIMITCSLGDRRSISRSFRVP